MSAKHATKSEVLVFAPALAPLDSEPLQTIVDMTATMISLECWGAKASFGHMLLAAHFGTMSLTAGAGGAAGPVASKTLDKLSVSYAVPPMSESDTGLGSTSYGQQYLAMRRTLMIVPLTGRAS